MAITVEDFKKELMERVNSWIAIFDDNFLEITPARLQDLYDAWTNDKTQIELIANNGSIKINDQLVELTAFIPTLNTFIEKAQKFFNEKINENKPKFISTLIKLVKIKMSEVKAIEKIENAKTGLLEAIKTGDKVKLGNLAALPDNYVTKAINERIKSEENNSEVLFTIDETLARKIRTTTADNIEDLKNYVARCSDKTPRAIEAICERIMSEKNKNILQILNEAVCKCILTEKDSNLLDVLHEAHIKIIEESHDDFYKIMLQKGATEISNAVNDKSPEAEQLAKKTTVNATHKILAKARLVEAKPNANQRSVRLQAKFRVMSVIGNKIVNNADIAETSLLKIIGRAILNPSLSINRRKPSIFAFS